MPAQVSPSVLVFRETQRFVFESACLFKHDSDLHSDGFNPNRERVAVVLQLIVHTLL